MKGLAFLITVLALSLFVTASAQEPLPAVYVDMTEVGGLTPEGEIPQGGANLTIPIRFHNVDDARAVISNGYYFHSDDVTANVDTADWNPAYPWNVELIYQIWICYPPDCYPWFDQGDWFTRIYKGLGGFGIAALTGGDGDGLPADFHDIAYSFELSDVSGPAGAVLTMDTTWWEPGNFWLWSGVMQNVSWGGPYEFQVQTDCTAPPTITSTPPTGPFNEGDPFYYDVEVSACGTVEFSFTSAPDGMNIDPVTGEIVWTCVPGIYSVTVRVWSPYGEDTQTFEIYVESGEIPPIFTNLPPEESLGQVGSLWTFDVDAEGDPEPVISLTIFPEGMAIDGGGVITWIPQPDQEGIHIVTLLASNGIEPDLSYSFLINVLPWPVPVRIIEIEDQYAQLGDHFTYDVDVENGYPAPVFSVEGPEGMTIGPVSGLIEWYVDKLGIVPVIVTATNALGTDEESFTITVSDCEPSTTCYPQPVELGVNDNDRIFEVTVYCEDVSEVDLASVRINNKIPCYTNDGVAYDNGDGSFTTDAFLMRFIGSAGFRPLDPGGIISTYSVSYMKGTEEITLVGDFVMKVNQADVTFDGVAGIDDIIFMTEHLFGGGPGCELDGYPMPEIMDVDQSGRFDLLDIRALIEIVY